MTKQNPSPLARLLPNALGTVLAVALWLGLTLIQASAAHAEEQLKVRVSWGHQSPASIPFSLKLLTNEVTATDLVSLGFEPDDHLQEGGCSTQAGGGDVDGIEFTLRFPEKPISVLTNLHRIWGDLITQSDADTARRLRQDPAYRRDSRTLTLQLDAEGTRGCSVTVDQLQQNKSFWVPSLDLYLAAGEPMISFAEHQQQLEPWKGQRVLDQVRRAPEATYEEFTARWQDMGNPAYKNPAQTGPGHIVGVTWDSALYKFGIDRGAGVWNDYGNPDRFHVWFDFGDLSQDLSATWKGQRLMDGLPVITTTFDRDGIHYVVEQFAYPLNGPPPDRQGDLPMVLLEKVTLSNPTEQLRSVPVKLRHRRLVQRSATVKLISEPNSSLLEESASNGILLSLEGAGLLAQARDLEEPPAKPEQPNKVWKATELALTVDLPAHGSREFVLRLPSPILPAQDRARLLAVSYPAARAQTLKFWSDYVAKGAQFRVPEAVVNDLFRANLWHALRLPRRHGGQGNEVKIDLPYSNFAYDQRGTPWPVNQAVYVDYMIYDLRGYHELAAEELQAIYRNNQEANGHVGGYANWVVYTPGMIYSVAKDYLLSGNRAAFETLLPQTLKALDWCLAEIQKGAGRSGPSAGLVRGPLNDGTGDGVWAFNQAYVYAGLDLLGKALEQIGHARAGECLAAADAFHRSVGRGFGAATMHSPLVQLRDHTWSPYVPCEVLTPHRLMQQWYPTDVDTGATHLPRLNAIPAQGPLADCLLNDHEDNLYLHAWGMANEPVYNQQATAYLVRDEPKAVIRAFYSMAACAFSHSLLEPVEHRWTWGQYFGPPSTDGAWFELYRQMLIRELDDGTLWLLQATPRKWLEPGEQIEIRNAPTYFGKLSLTAKSQADSRLTVDLDMPDRTRPKTLLLRLRHPQNKPIQSVSVNGQSWTEFDPQKEWVRINNPDQAHYSVTAQY